MKYSYLITYTVQKNNETRIVNEILKDRKALTLNEFNDYYYSLKEIYKDAYIAILNIYRFEHDE